MLLDPSQMAWKEAYRVVTGAVLPRPIAFVSTVSAEGILNLAPFSFFTVVAADPLTLAFCPMRRDGDGAKKDTLVNIEATGGFVINIVSPRVGEALAAYECRVHQVVEVGGRSRGRAPWF